MSLPVCANPNPALHSGQIIQSTTFNSNNPVANLAICPFGTPYQAMPYQPYQSNLLHYGYERNNEKRVYQVDNNLIDNQSESFYIIFELKEGDVNYLDKGFDKDVVNFVEIKTVCSRCYRSFSSKSKLHNHIKVSCLKESFLASFTQPSLSISIIVSKARHQSFKLSLIFRGWTYAITSIILTPEHLLLGSDPKSMVYLDTGCGVTFVVRDWLLKHLPGQKINTISTFLKVREIKTFKHKFVEFIALSLYFPGRDNAKQLVYILFKCEIYLGNRFQVNLLIKNNILSPKGFVINIKKKKVLIETCGVTIAINAK